MAVLLMRLVAPLQAWGVRSRFSVRSTELAPSRSGVLGLVASAEGRRRTDPLEDLLSLRFGVRSDQPGTVIRDFHTARSLDGKESMPLSERYYLADAAFLAGIEGERSLLEGLDAALRRPAFPPYLGRRSCPPALPVPVGLRDGDLLSVLTDEPWIASPWFRRKHRAGLETEIRIDADALPEHRRRRDSRMVRDVPVSFDQRRREYGFREVERVPVHLGEVTGAAHGLRDPLDPMAVLGAVGQFSDPLDPMSSVIEVTS
ncbi:type I-E CRISPR-associated protein Cas5/CasD [Actinomyces radicidentis]|uniref:type I-E CRISPR-associated protein Cas5/CasD n=1 Tax=Actinomyces radicidentis TaxID=111015 RepID=UPI0028E57875|nr:type I-E CRISPR-associated protein Cas5/CasD [Actinomyces radicidentis]